MAKRTGGIPGMSFSWKRAVGISSAKAKLSKSIRIPLTKSGRQRKAGAALGCGLIVLVVCLVPIAGAYIFRVWFKQFWANSAPV